MILRPSLLTFQRVYVKLVDCAMTLSCTMKYIVPNKTVIYRTTLRVCQNVKRSLLRVHRRTSTSPCVRLCVHNNAGCIIQQNSSPGVAALLIGYSNTYSNLCSDPNLNADPNSNPTLDFQMGQRRRSRSWPEIYFGDVFSPLFPSLVPLFTPSLS